MRGNRGGRNNNNRNNSNNNNNFNGNNHSNYNNNRNNSNNPNNQPGHTKILNVGGWVNSNASSDSDGGVSGLHGFLEKKSHKRIVRAYRNGDLYVITVNTNDISDFLRLDNVQFAGIKLIVQDPSDSSGRPSQQGGQGGQLGGHAVTSQSPGGGRGGSRGGRRGDAMQTDQQSIDAGVDQVEQALIQVIQNGYDPGPKFLNLSGLPKNPIIMSVGLNSQPASKVFSALFVCCETKVFETPLKRQQMVESLSLGHNGLMSVKDCIAAAGTFNHIKNLDLSGNQISDIGELRYWRNRFPNLEHLVLTDNPIDAHPETRRKMKQWYPKLKMYNGQPIPEEDDPLAAAPKPMLAAVELLPYSLHPEYKEGERTDFGQPAPDKPGDQVMKEQMILRFSYETRLTLVLSHQCLEANNWDYIKSIENLRDLTNKGQIQDSFLWGPPPMK